MDHWRRFVLGYFSAMVAVYLAGLLAGTLAAGEPALHRFVYDPVLPALLFYLPPVVSAVSAYRNGGLLASIAVGLVPSVAFGVMSLIGGLFGFGADADSPLWALMLAFAAVGVVGAVLGYVAGSAGRWVGAAYGGTKQ